MPTLEFGVTSPSATRPVTGRPTGSSRSTGSASRSRPVAPWVSPGNPGAGSRASPSRCCGCCRRPPGSPGRSSSTARTSARCGGVGCVRSGGPRPRSCSRGRCTRSTRCSRSGDRSPRPSSCTSRPARSADSRRDRSPRRRAARAGRPARSRARAYPHELSGGQQSADHDRDGFGVRPGRDHRRRADHRPRRRRPGAGAGRAQRPGPGSPPDPGDDQPRPRRPGGRLRADRGDEGRGGRRGRTRRTGDHRSRSMPTPASWQRRSRPSATRVAAAGRACRERRARPGGAADHDRRADRWRRHVGDGATRPGARGA